MAHLADSKDPAEEGTRRGKERKAKMELFEHMRVEYEFGEGTVLGIAPGGSASPDVTSGAATTLDCRRSLRMIEWRKGQNAKRDQIEK
jgi:hypothetical protein